MEVIRRGQHGTAAKLAQLLLNDRLSELIEVNGKPFVPLQTDGIFGPKSEKALIDFIARVMQVSRPPVIDDDVWRRLGLKIEIDHRVPLVGQPLGGLCWSAAAAMILGGPMSVSPGGATLGKRDSLEPSLENVAVFGESLGWRLLNQSTQNLATFVDLLRRKPLWMAGQGTAASGRRYGHAIVVSGLWSDGDSNGSSTLLRIHDPWPGPKGRIFDTWFFGPLGIRLPGNTWFKPETILVPG